VRADSEERRWFGLVPIAAPCHQHAMGGTPSPSRLVQAPMTPLGVG
jgi:hypothetical protein